MSRGVTGTNIDITVIGVHKDDIEEHIDSLKQDIHNYEMQIATLIGVDIKSLVAIEAVKDGPDTIAEEIVNSLSRILREYRESCGNLLRLEILLENKDKLEDY